MDAPLVGLLVAAFGVLLAILGALGLRVSGANAATARRLAGPREFRVGDLATLEPLPDRPIRVAGRIRCRDPLEIEGAEPLVAYHRDVEVRLPGVGWRSVERLREARSFELWDHRGSITIDPARAAEPLLSIPAVWRGPPDRLGEPHASSIARLAERHGAPTEARSTLRSLAVTDRLLVVARAVRRAPNEVGLEPPPGGFLVTNLPLDAAMRLLGGRNRRLTVASVAAIGIGALTAAASLVVAAGLWLIGP